MPVSILTPSQRHRYGRFRGEPTPEQLAKQCYLAPAEIAIVMVRRQQAWQQMGYAIQLMTVRFLGTFLEQGETVQVPRNLIAFAAQQLQLTHIPDLTPYAIALDLVKAHRSDIRERFAYADFHDVRSAFEAWLHVRVLHTGHSLLELFDLSTAWCLEHQVLLPAATTLERTVASVHEQALSGMWREISALIRRGGHVRPLLALLTVSPETGRNGIDELQRAPKRQSSIGMQDSERRVERFQQIGVSDLDLSPWPAARIREMAEHAVLTKSSQLQVLQPERKLATLLAFVHEYEIAAIDDFLDLFDVLMMQAMSNSEKKAGETRLGGLRELDKAALVLALVCDVVLDKKVANRNVRRVIFAKTERQALADALKIVRAQCRTSRQYDLIDALADRHRRTAALVGPLIRALSLQAGSRGQTILQQVAFAKQLLADAKTDLADAPLDGLSKVWRGHVLDERDRVRKHGYLAWVATRLREALRRHDVYVTRSVKWANVEGQIVADDATWQLAQRPQFCTAFDLPQDGVGLLARFEAELDAAYRDAGAALSATGARARFEGEDLVVAPIEAEDDTESLGRLRTRTSQMLPIVDLAEILLEIDQTTGFTQDFVPRASALAREPGLSRTICAALMADSCNLPYRVVADPDDPALTEERIGYVHQQFIRADTISAANRRLVSEQDRLPLVRQHWGLGHVASADGLRFRVPVAAPNALPNRKYFGSGKGVTYFSFTSDQFTGLHGIVIPGTIRDSLYLLEARLRMNTTLQPTEIMTDMASASDAVFALFWFQGYEFRPRFVDLSDKRFWRFDPAADYGPWNPLSRHMLSRERILEGYDAVLRLSASLREGTVSAHAVMRMLGGSGRGLTALGRAAVEIGRVIKTRHMLRLATDEYYARRIHAQLNRGEQRNGLARQVFFGRRGALYRSYVAGQENQLGTLGFVLNAIVLWNTIYLDAALEQMRSAGQEVIGADIAHLTPLGHAHIRVEGRYQFSLAPGLARGQLRRLRTPRPDAVPMAGT